MPATTGSTFFFFFPFFSVFCFLHSTLDITDNPDMNYVSVVYAVVAVILLTDWFIRGRKSYHGVQQTQEVTAE